MSLAIWLALALFVITDIVVITLVIRRMKPALLGTGMRGAGQKQILQSAEAMVGEYMRVNYSGDPQHLPTALAGLLPQLRDMLRAQGVEPQPEILRALVEISATRRRIATSRQLREALARIG